jgi:hypothetical protein
MRYWAMARALGMTEEEFWASTYALIAILYRVKELEWSQRRDFFTATLIAMKATSEHRTYTATEILALAYPQLPDEETSDIDPDFGASGNWRALKAELKGTHAS